MCMMVYVWATQEKENKKGKRKVLNVGYSCRVKGPAEEHPDPETRAKETHLALNQLKT